jgi:hypothetical protein
MEWDGGSSIRRPMKARFPPNRQCNHGKQATSLILERQDKSQVFQMGTPRYETPLTFIVSRQTFSNV